MNNMHELPKAWPIFIFDFDGVVCDSTDECMVTSWNAWNRWRGFEGLRSTVSGFSVVERNQFRKMRPRVRGAGEYYILRRAMDEGILINDQATYARFEEKWHEYLQPFKQIFFEMRNLFRSENLDLWIDLHPIFQEVVEVMKYLHSENRLYIATMKDGESVRLILGKQGLDLLPNNMLDQSQIISKVQALDRIRDQLSCNKNKMIFIDDNVTHLLEPKQAGYPVWMSNWGTVLPEYLNWAHEERIAVLSIKKLQEIRK